MIRGKKRWSPHHDSIEHKSYRESQIDIPFILIQFSSFIRKRWELRALLINAEEPFLLLISFDLSFCMTSDWLGHDHTKILLFQFHCVSDDSCARIKQRLLLDLGCLVSTSANIIVSHRIDRFFGIFLFPSNISCNSFRILFYFAAVYSSLSEASIFIFYYQNVIIWK